MKYNRRNLIKRKVSIVHAKIKIHKMRLRIYKDIYVQNYFFGKGNFFYIF